MRLLHRGCLNVLVTGLVSVALCASASASGALCAGLFEDQIIIWKSVDDLEQAVEKIARGELSDGDLDDLLECWASPVPRSLCWAMWSTANFCMFSLKARSARVSYSRKSMTTDSRLYSI